MNQHVVILGGGVIGVTTAVVLRVLGYDVQIASEQFLWEESSDPVFASIYPAASVIPHNIGGFTKGLFDASQAVFRKIADTHPHVVRTQKHFELTEGENRHKEYFEWVNAQHTSNEHGLWGISVPRRSKAKQVEGVGFEMMFVEMPAFKAFLKEAVNTLHIQTTHRKIDRQFLEENAIQNKIICNCLGSNGYTLLNDDAPPQAVAGILVSCPIYSLLKNPVTNTPVSYNYLFEGVEAYSYPRAQDVLFGGTRIRVDYARDPIEQLVTHFEERAISFRWINDIPVPNYIIDVNKEIYQQLYGVHIATDKAHALLGLRPVRQGGPRLHKDKRGLVHSYGYGGAGVTLSWGAALEVGRMVEENFTLENTLSNLLKHLSYIPQDVTLLRKKNVSYSPLAKFSSYLVRTFRKLCSCYTS